MDVEGTQLGNDVVTEQFSAFTAVMSSLIIILFVLEVVNNPALYFLYHTTKLGKMFPKSERASGCHQRPFGSQPTSS